MIVDVNLSFDRRRALTHRHSVVFNFDDFLCRLQDLDVLHPFISFISALEVGSFGEKTFDNRSNSLTLLLVPLTTQDGDA
jgi:hypothetical protein